MVSEGLKWKLVLSVRGGPGDGIGQGQPCGHLVSGAFVTTRISELLQVDVWVIASFQQWTGKPHGYVRDAGRAHRYIMSVTEGRKISSGSLSVCIFLLDFLFLSKLGKHKNADCICSLTGNAVL